MSAQILAYEKFRSSLIKIRKYAHNSLTKTTASSQQRQTQDGEDCLLSSGLSRILVMDPSMVWTP